MYSIWSKLSNVWKNIKRIKKIENNEQIRNFFIMGIETSCDDTGCAIVNDEGKILGESLNSQHLVHLKLVHH